ncbi:hypothetical protein P7C71_g4808, partial [Lecanoromycetidae sp. Uapishka_2]
MRPHHLIPTILTLTSLSTAHLLPAQSEVHPISKRQNNDNFDAGNCAVLWDSSIPAGKPMDLHIFDAALNPLYTNTQILVPSAWKSTEFDCNMDAPCAILGLYKNYPVFSYLKQSIQMPPPDKAAAPNPDSGADAAYPFLFIMQM